MIIFYNKETGDIVGSINGRVHEESHHTMSVGDPEEVDRLVVEWRPVKYYDKDGLEVPSDSPVKHTADFEANHVQKELFDEIDQTPIKLYDYKVDLVTKQLVRK